VSASLGSSEASPQTRSGGNKLVRCAGCGTWIPENRSLNLKSGLAIYCSPECLERKSDTKERRIAG